MFCFSKLGKQQIFSSSRCTYTQQSLIRSATPHHSSIACPDVSPARNSLRCTHLRWHTCRPLPCLVSPATRLTALGGALSVLVGRRRRQSVSIMVRATSLAGSFRMAARGRGAKKEYARTSSQPMLCHAANQSPMPLGRTHGNPWDTKDADSLQCTHARFFLFLHGLFPRSGEQRGTVRVETDTASCQARSNCFEEELHLQSTDTKLTSRTTTNL